MNRKTLIQLFLFLIVLIISVTIFAKYFNEEKISKKNNVIDKNVEENINEKTNIIKNIEYFQKTTME